MSSRKTIDPSHPLPLRAGIGLYVLLLLVAGVVCYANSLDGALLFDDLNVLPSLTKLPMTWESVWTTFRHGSLRGFGNFTFVLNDWLGGPSPVSLHVVNIVIHLAAGLTLFGLVRRTLELPGMTPSLRARALPLAFVIALIWIVHPLQTQAVTYLVQRYESLMGLFYLLTLYCVVRSHTSARPLTWQMLTIACTWLGLLSKEVMVTAPLAVLLYDRVYLSASWREVWNERRWMYIGFIMPMVLGAIVLAPLVFSRESDATVGLGVRSVTPLLYAANQSGVILHYLQLAIWPRHLCLDYEWPVSREISAVLPSILILLCLLALTAFAWSRWPKLAYVATLFFLILAPTSSIVPIQDLAFEHRMYLPLAAVIVLCVLGVDAILQRVCERFDLSPAMRRMVPIALLAIVVVMLVARTVIRNEDYRSPLAMWTSTLRVRPQNARALHHVMRELDQANRTEEAYAVGERIIEINQLRGVSTAEQHLYLGELYALHQHWEQAIPNFETAIAAGEKEVDLSPTHRQKLADAHLSLGVALVLTQQLPAARQHFERALQLSPDSAAAQTLLKELNERPGSGQDQPEATRRGMVKE